MATESNETQPVSTEVTIGGQRFELKNMTAEQGAALYALLSPEDKKLADSIAAIAKNFHSISSIELPPGMSVTTALDKYFTALKAGRGKIEDGAAAFLKQMDGFIGELPAVQGIRRLAGAANTAADVWDGAVRGFMAPYRALMATPGLAGTLTPGTNISDEQARAFGAAYAAAEAMHRTPAKEEGIGGFFASTSRTLGYGYMRLMHSLPFIPTVMSAIGHWFQGLPANWDFGAAWDKAKEEVASEQKAELNKYGGHMPTLEQYQTHARQVGMQEKARPAAAAMVTAAWSIAGIEAPKLVEAITKGGIIRTHQGGLAQVTIQDGRPVQEAAKGPDGKPLTVGTERRGMLDEALPQPGRGTGHHLAYGAAVAAGTYGAVRYGPRVVEAGVDAARAAGGGVIRATTGVASGLLQGWAGLAGGREVARSIGALNTMESLVAREAEAAKRLADLQAKTNPSAREQRITQRLETRLGDATNPAPNSLRGKIETLDTKIDQAPAPTGAPRQNVGIRIADVATDLEKAGASATAQIAGTAANEAAVGASRLGRVSRGVGRFFGRAATPLAVGMSAWDVADGMNTGNMRSVVTGGAELGTMGAGAAIGAGIGVWFGGIGAIPGAAIGAGIGGIVSLATGAVVGVVYDANTRTTQPASSSTTAPPTRSVSAPIGSTGTPDPGLAAAHAEQNAQKARDQARYAMAGAKSTTLGAVHSVADGATVQSSKVAFVPVAAAPIAFDFA